MIERHKEETNELMKEIENIKGITTDNVNIEMDSKFAADKSALVEKHYKEFADALADLAPDQNSNAKDAHDAAIELEKTRLELEQKKQLAEDDMLKQKQAFEAEQNKQMEAEL